jgi:hypothetical protein
MAGGHGARPRLAGERHGHRTVREGSEAPLGSPRLAWNARCPRRMARERARFPRWRIPDQARVKDCRIRDERTSIHGPSADPRRSSSQRSAYATRMLSPVGFGGALCMASRASDSARSGAVPIGPSCRRAISTRTANDPRRQASGGPAATAAAIRVASRRISDAATRAADAGCAGLWQTRHGGRTGCSPPPRRRSCPGESEPDAACEGPTRAAVGAAWVRAPIGMPTASPVDVNGSASRSKRPLSSPALTPDEQRRVRRRGRAGGGEAPSSNTCRSSCSPSSSSRSRSTTSTGSTTPRMPSRRPSRPAPSAPSTHS